MTGYEAASPVDAGRKAITQLQVRTCVNVAHDPVHGGRANPHEILLGSPAGSGGRRRPRANPLPAAVLLACSRGHMTCAAF